MTAIPDRWTAYSPIGRKIKGTRFIAFKVPLKEHISVTVDQKTRLDCPILLKSIPNLGLIIDLTNTARYYNPDYFISKGIKYQKLMIPGGQVPPKTMVKRFHMIVKQFLDYNHDNDKLIGVHCTHGVNRTGYLICNYMISEMAMEPKQALERFAEARGHKIERTNYVDGLHNLGDINWRKSGDKRQIKQENWRGRREHNVQPGNFRQPRDYYRHTDTFHYRRDNTHYYPHSSSRTIDRSHNRSNYYNRQPTNEYYGRYLPSRNDY